MAERDGHGLQAGAVKAQDLQRRGAVQTGELTQLLGVRQNP